MSAKLTVVTRSQEATSVPPVEQAWRNKQYASIHAALTRRGVPDGEYRAHLMSEYGTDTAKGLGRTALAEVARWANGEAPAKSKRKADTSPVNGDAVEAARPPRPSPAQVVAHYFPKIDACLIALGNYSRGYAAGIARRMYGRPLEWLQAHELRGVITALERQLAKRKASKPPLPRGEGGGEGDGERNEPVERNDGGHKNGAPPTHAAT